MLLCYRLLISKAASLLFVKGLWGRLLLKRRRELSQTPVINQLKKGKIMSTENNNESKKKSTWDLILKVIIAVASALAGVLGANAMNL